MRCDMPRLQLLTTMGFGTCQEGGPIKADLATAVIFSVNPPALRLRIWEGLCMRVCGSAPAMDSLNGEPSIVHYGRDEPVI